MDSSAVTVSIAAHVLHVSPSQLRRWIQAGAPVASSARPMRVNVDDVRRWRCGSDPLTVVADALLDVLRRDCGAGAPAPRLLGISDRHASALLLAAYDRACVAMTGHEATEPWPAAIETLRTIAARELG